MNPLIEAIRLDEEQTRVLTESTEGSIRGFILPINPGVRTTVEAYVDDLMSDPAFSVPFREDIERLDSGFPFSLFEPTSAYSIVTDETRPDVYIHERLVDAVYAFPLIKCWGMPVGTKWTGAQCVFENYLKHHVHSDVAEVAIVDAYLGAFLLKNQPTPDQKARMTVQLPAIATLPHFTFQRKDDCLILTVNTRPRSSEEEILTVDLL